MTPTKEPKKVETPKKRIAVVRVKGKPGLKVGIKKTLQFLRLYKKHHCVIISSTPTQIGMLETLKHVATWGELDNETCKLLFEKRGRVAGKKPLTDAYVKEKIKCSLAEFATKYMNFQAELDNVPGMKKFFKLSPPRQGFEKKGIKTPFSMGGVVGYRKEKINNLIQRMI
jgi:large subunit ribosomal protein L30